MAPAKFLAVGNRQVCRYVLVVWWQTGRSAAFETGLLLKLVTAFFLVNCVFDPPIGYLIVVWHGGKIM